MHELAISSSDFVEVAANTASAAASSLREDQPGGHASVGRSHPSMSGQFRYSIRSLLISIAVLAFGIWSFMVPSIQSHRFIHALNSRNNEAAQQLYPASSDTYVDFTALPSTISIKALVEAPTLRDMYRGQRSISVWFLHPKTPVKTGMFNGSAVLISLRGTRHGVELVDRHPNPFIP